MAGLYIHIPFCRSRCIYCGFYSTVELKLRQRYVDALCREMELKGTSCLLASPQDAAPLIDTVYLGGGTPSQLTPDQLRQLFHYINNVYSLAPHPEVTIEVNPDDVSPQFAAMLSQLPVNRVSMGAQTFDDQRLRFLHRRHTARQVSTAVQHIRHAGIRNVSIDLMYGFPGETLGDWQRDIEAALALGVEHISAYCLIVEEGTVLCEQMNNRRSRFNPGQRNENEEMINEQAEELERQMYETLIDRLAAAGYEHYEISNFARPGYRSRHNGSYWNDEPYIGLGAAAHGYDLTSRSWNVADIHQYIKAIEKGEIPCEREALDADTHYNDRITTALRTCDGLDLATLSDHHRSHCLREARPFLDNALLRLSDNRLFLTRRGLFVSDMVMSQLMLV